MTAWDELRKANPQELKRPLLMLQYALAPILMTADVVRSNTTMTALTDLSVDVENGKKYSILIILHVNDSTNQEGIKFDLAAGTATVSLIRAHCEFKDLGFSGLKQITALNTLASIDSLAGGDATVEIKGSLVASADGTIIPRVAQNSHSSGSLTIYELSSIQLQEIPA